MQLESVSSHWTAGRVHPGVKLYIYIVGCHVLNVALILLPVSADGFDLAPLTMPEISVYVRASRF